MGIAAFVTAISSLVFFNTGNTSGSNAQQNFISQEPKLCRVVSPPGGRYLAKLRPQPHTEVGALKQVNLGEKVLFIQKRGDFVEVQLSDGTQGWLFDDEIQRCDASKMTHKMSH
jgi:serine/threonine-protein kinase